MLQHFLLTLELSLVEFIVITTEHLKKIKHNSLTLSNLKQFKNVYFQFKE